MFKNQNFIIRIFFLFLFALCVQVSTSAITEHDSELFNAPNVTDKSVLSIKDCVALAFKNSPLIRRKKYKLDIAKGKVGLAKSRYFPTLGAGAYFNYERNSDSIYYEKKYRDLPKVNVFVDQLIYDFGKTTSFIKMEEFTKISAEYEFIDEICSTLFEIKRRYYDLLRASSMFDVAKKNVELSKEFLEISKGDIDRMTAEIYLIDAEGEYVTAKQNYNNAKYNLSNAMFLDNHINYSIKKTPTFDFDINQDMISSKFNFVAFPFKNSEATEIAYKNSPDLQVVINTKNAMEQSLKYIRKKYLPDLTGNVGYVLNNTYNTANNSLQVGVGLSASTNLKELKHNIDIASAELNIADNEILLFKKDLYYEVQRALNNVDLTGQQIPDTKREIDYTIKNLELAKNGYLSGKLDYTDLQNAKKDFIRVQRDYINFIYDYNMALIQTEMATHSHIVDIHHKSEHAIHEHAEELIEHLNEVMNCSENEHKNSRKNKQKKVKK